MASTPASYHAPALHYRARGSISRLLVEEISTFDSTSRLCVHFTQWRLDCGYEAIKIELRKRQMREYFLNLL
jgi:hypothetical protein